jgi:hypothetical protein
MMIVSARRSDLRDRFLPDRFFMADEAFALSPISARAAMPGEADYDAISAAFMETSRGRWFLSEYAKRNRNADTRMVLDAVARIEANIAAQKDATPEHALAEVLAAIRQAVDEARAAAALGGVAVEESLAPIREGAQVIRETLLRLREIGVGGRIYDLMDSQVGTIEAGCAQIASTDAKAALSAAFDLIDHRIKQFESDDTVRSSVRETPPPPSAAMDQQTPAATVEFAPSPEAAAAMPSGDVAATAQIETAAIAAAHDEAVLDMIALEMAAPDFDEPEIAEAHVMEVNSVEPDIISQADEPAVPLPESAPVPQPSLGASLIAHGIVLRPVPSAADPLAPIRRMSQAEKIAFFS